jgi:hypothetical protein
MSDGFGAYAPPGVPVAGSLQWGPKLSKAEAFLNSFDASRPVSASILSIRNSSRTDGPKVLPDTTLVELTTQLNALSCRSHFAFPSDGVQCVAVWGRTPRLEPTGQRLLQNNTVSRYLPSVKKIRPHLLRNQEPHLLFRRARLLFVPVIYNPPPMSKLRTAVVVPAPPEPDSLKGTCCA